MNVQVATLPQYSSTAGTHTLRIYNILYYNIQSDTGCELPYLNTLP
jgi:hypothetical protein